MRIQLWLGMLLCSLASVALATERVNIYSFRQPFLIEPILAEFSAQTGIETRVIFAQDGLLQRLQREGRLSPADVVLTTDFANLLELKQLGLTQPFQLNNTLTGNIPAHLRDSEQHWLALTKRTRNVYVSRDRSADITDITYEQLVEPRFKGKICTRSGKHPYNLALIASMIAHHGEAEAEQWLRGLKANLARKPQGNDRAQVRAVYEGLCDIAIGNSYYLGKMLEDENQIAWAESVNILYPNRAERGTHINVSGAAIARHAPNKNAAQALLEFLSSAKAQEIYAQINMEYPVKPGVAPSALIQSWGTFKEDELALEIIAKYHQAALALVDKVRFDL